MTWQKREAGASILWVPRQEPENQQIQQTHHAWTRARSVLVFQIMNDRDLLQISSREILDTDRRLNRREPIRKRSAGFFFVFVDSDPIRSLVTQT